MRIFKNTPNVHTCIAGEIINLLTSTQYFDAGELLEKPIRDYPSIIDSNVVYSIDLEKTCVYYPYGYNYVNNYNKISDKIKELYGMISEEESQRMYWHMKCDNSSLTVVRTKKKRSSLEYILKNYKLANFYPGFGYTESGSKYGTFMRDCGIFVDTSDLTHLEHNSVTFEVNEKLFPSTKNIINNKVLMSDLSNPIAFELNLRKNSKRLRRRFIHKKIVHVSYDSIPGLNTLQKCCDCKSLLYGDNYVFQGNIAKSNMNERIVVCPLCTHYSSNYDINYFSVFTVTYPKSIHDAIDLIHTDTKADILHAIVEKRKYFTFEDIDFIVAGSSEGRYIITQKPYDFAISEAFKWYKDHKIVTLVTC